MFLEKYVFLFVSMLSLPIIDTKIQKELIKKKNDCIYSYLNLPEYKNTIIFKHKYEQYKNKYNKKNKN